MGRKGAVAGLARFVQQAFSTDGQPAQSTQSDGIVQLKVSHPRDDSVQNNLPSKKRKTKQKVSRQPQHDHDSTFVSSWDATHLVPFRAKAADVPHHLKKYFSQRHRLFSLYDHGCLLDDEGWYSVTPELIANQIAERCRCDTVLDAFCGVGGNAIAFAQTCERVIALDTSPTRLALARHNAQIYGVAGRIEFILADYLQFASSYLSQRAIHPASQRKIDVVFLSPPWGGPEYLGGLSGEQEDSSTEECPTYSLKNIRPIHGSELFHLSKKISQNVAYYLPRNTRVEEISALLGDSTGTVVDKELDYGSPSGGPSVETPPEKIEIEEEWMGTKLKALTCYFGGLVKGQGVLF